MIRDWTSVQSVQKVRYFYTERKEKYEGTDQNYDAFAH